MCQRVAITISAEFSAKRAIQRCSSLLVRMPSSSENEAKMVFRLGSRPDTQPMKSTAVHHLPCCGGVQITIFGRLPATKS